VRRVRQGERLVPPGEPLYSDAVNAVLWAEVPTSMKRTRFTSTDEDLRAVDHSGHRAIIDTAGLPEPMQ
jgi:hypothetical protein